MAVAPRADLAVSAGEDAVLISWDLKTGRQVRRISLGNAGHRSAWPSRRTAAES